VARPLPVLGGASPCRGFHAMVPGMAKLRLRVDLEPDGQVGPGKIALLELIDRCGSIAAAGRAMRMSYRRAWELTDSINQCFREPAVSTQLGGTSGGGASLTPFGRELVKHYRAIEKKAERAAASHLKVLQSARAGQR